MEKITSTLALALVCTLCGCQTARNDSAWEYKQVYANLSDQQLNDYAKQGWHVDQIIKGRETGSEWVYILLKRRAP